MAGNLTSSLVLLSARLADDSQATERWIFKKPLGLFLWTSASTLARGTQLRRKPPLTRFNCGNCPFKDHLHPHTCFNLRGYWRSTAHFYGKRFLQQHHVTLIHLRHHWLSHWLHASAVTLHFLLSWHADRIQHTVRPGVTLMLQFGKSVRDLFFLPPSPHVLSLSLPLLPSQHYLSIRKSLTQYYGDIIGPLTALLK